MPLFRRKSSDLSPADLAFDVHSHLLPGVDDGVRDLDEAMRGIQVLSDLGYRGAVTTPHIRQGKFDNDEDHLRKTFDLFHSRLTKHLAEQGGAKLQAFQLALAAEYTLDDSFRDKLFGGAEGLLRFGPGEKYLLLELPTAHEPVDLADVLSACGDRGVTPVLAHVERYRYVGYADGLDKLRAWRERGVLLQVNLASLVGRYGNDVRRVARDAWAASLVDILGSDMHRPASSAETLPNAWRYLKRHPNAFEPATQQGLLPSAD